jgi:transcriptional regulator with XRE-family HTH domain
MTRRPIEDYERPHLAELGTALRTLRQHAGLSRAVLADRTGMNQRSISRIESGERRTRRSTLTRLLTCLVNEDETLGEMDHLLDGLVRRAGPALAAESPYQGRIDARRLRREKRKEREWLRAMAVADEAERLAHLYIEQQITQLRRHGQLT